MTDVVGGAAAAKPAFPLSASDIENLAGKSPELGALLRTAEMERIVTAYDREDQRATVTQAQFAHVATQLNRAILATGVISALILVLGLLQPAIAAPLDRVMPYALAAFGFSGLLVGGYAAARLYELNAGDLAGDWMQTRARAEQLRGEYFERLVARAVKASIATQSLVFDIVNQHLLEDQLDYFARRGKRHEAAATRWLRWSAFATGIASVGVAAGGMAGAEGNPWIMAIAAFGAIGGALAAFAAAQEAIGQERERAQRFRNNVDALEQLARQIDDVRTAVVAGSPEPLVTFTAAINQQLALELGRFLAGGDSIRTSIAKLGQQIEASRKSKAPPAQPEEKP